MKLTYTLNQPNEICTLLCAGANVSTLHEPHGLAGFGCALVRAAWKLVWRIDYPTTCLVFLDNANPIIIQKNNCTEKLRM